MARSEHSVVLRCVILAASLVVSACGPAAAPEPYTGVFPTKEAAASAVLDAIAASDAVRLERLAVTAAEFRKNVWPHLPSSRPEVGMPVDYVWSDTHTRSLGQLQQVLGEYGGRRSTLEALSFSGAVTDYGAFRVHRKSHLRLRDQSGHVHETRLFGSMIESPAGWKVFSYIID